MKFAILTAIFALIAISHGEELVRTPQYLRKQSNSRIVGGYEADISEFPHMLALFDMSPTWNGFICGASVIHTHWALSAAHCTDRNTPPSQMQLRGGSTNRNLGIVFLVQAYTNHPRFDRTWLDFDIVIIQVQAGTPIQGPNIQIIPLSPVCNQLCCQACEPQSTTISGWGRTELGGGTTMLRQITLPIFNQAECDRIWRGVGNEKVCVWAGDGRDSCSGDSGSPLVRTIMNQRFQIALVSFGSAVCGDGSGPSVNVRIEYPEVRNWITELSGV